MTGREVAVTGCRFCGAEVPAERVEIGYTHCTGAECVAAWRRERIHDNQLALVLVPKQGVAWVTLDHVDENNRSSGR